MLAALVISQSVPALARTTAEPESAYSATTSVGVHNAYEKHTYGYFADALDSGAGLLELDVWTNSAAADWRVAHNNPVASESNCTGTGTGTGAVDAAQLRTLPQDQGLAGCLSDLRVWHDANPGHRPVMIKVEMKDGFNTSGGLGPREFDALLGERLGPALFRPSDLTGDAPITLDEAVRSQGWPGRGDLAGKFIIELIPGTVEEMNPADPLWTDVEYATHLRDLAAVGALDQASAFPAVHGATVGDPRESRYPDATIRPWFVIFDGDASAYVDGRIDTAWYRDRGYLLVMTDAHKVAPAIDGTRPSEEAARARVDELAVRHASFVTADWHPLPGVLSRVAPRG